MRVGYAYKLSSHNKINICNAHEILPYLDKKQGNLDALIRKSQVECRPRTADCLLWEFMQYTGYRYLP